MQIAKILLVEDEPAQRQLVQEILQDAGYQVASCASVLAAKNLLEQEQFDVVFSDWKLEQSSGLDLLQFVRQHYIDLGFVIATAYGTIAHAVEAMQAGADDYLSKPFQRQELLLTIQKALTAHQLKSHNNALQSQLSQQNRLVELVGNAPSMQRVYQRIERVSATDATILITGESGTGKELAARALHRLSQRHQNDFIAVNCGAIPESLAEAELFGAEKGAFTGANQTKIGKLEAASGGTLFLDEIGELPLTLQPQLLRFLQEGTITRVGSHKEIKLDVRVIAATHRNLPEQIADNQFREDLYYRLNVVPIEMPPLRARTEDLPQLIEHFLQRFGQRYGGEAPTLSKKALAQLLNYSWPGNVRELSNLIERFTLLGDELELLSQLGQQQVISTDNFTLPEDGIQWEAFEKGILQQALDRCQGNRTKAAQLLGLNYKAFLYRLEKYQLV